MCVNGVCVPGQAPQRRFQQQQQQRTTPRPSFAQQVTGGPRRRPTANSLNHSNGQSFARTFQNALNRQSGVQEPVVPRRRGNNVVSCVLVTHFSSLKSGELLISASRSCPDQHTGYRCTTTTIYHRRKQSTMLQRRSLLCRLGPPPGVWRQCAVYVAVLSEIVSYLCL